MPFGGKVDSRVSKVFDGVQSRLTTRRCSLERTFAGLTHECTAHCSPTVAGECACLAHRQTNEFASMRGDKNEAIGKTVCFVHFLDHHAYNFSCFGY